MHRQHQLVYFGLLALLTVTLTGVGVVVLQRALAAQQQGIRRIAYAATATQLARPTPLPTLTPSPYPTITPILIPTAHDLQILPTPSVTVTLPPDASPRATLIPHSDDLVNFLVLGSDRQGGNGVYRTDVILVVSVNRTTQTVNLLSIPRDLYVYIPGWGMDRVNTAEVHQTQTHQTGHRLGLLAETVEYNLGLEIHHLARVDFSGFRALVDSLGGLTVPVDCPVSGFQLGSPDLDPDEPANWVPFTLEPGIYHMDGSMSLWYVRQRTDSSDFDRNRRQQIILRALWHTLIDSDLLRNLPAIWGEAMTLVETDLTLNEAIGFLPLLLRLDSSRIEGHFLGLDEVNLWQTPNGARVLVIDPLPFQRTMRYFLTPPTDNQLVQEQAQVEVINASSIAHADQLAAARLAWMGLVAFPQGETRSEFPTTTIYDHTGRTKGSSLNALQTILGVAEGNIVLVQDVERIVDFTVVVGDNYVPCLTSAWQPFAQPE